MHLKSVKLSRQDQLQFADKTQLNCIAISLVFVLAEVEKGKMKSEKRRNFEAERGVSGENRKNPFRVSLAFAHYAISSEASTPFPEK